MSNNNTIFHPFFFIRKSSNIIFFRSNIEFLLPLLKCLIEKKTFFLTHKELFFTFIKNYITKYNNTQYLKKEIYNLYKNILYQIEYIYKQNNINLYTYILSFIGIMIYYGYYNICIISLTHIDKNDFNNITDIVNTIIKKYNINPKLLLLGINKTLKKGMQIQYKDTMIDISLKKCQELINNKITISTNGAL